MKLVDHNPEPLPEHVNVVTFGSPTTQFVAHVAPGANNPPDTVHPTLPAFVIPLDALHPTEQEGTRRSQKRGGIAISQKNFKQCQRQEGDRK